MSLKDEFAKVLRKVFIPGKLCLLSMDSAVLSEKFQVVIPKQVRDLLHLKAKQELAIWVEGDAIHLTPLKKLKDPVRLMSSVSKKKIRLSIEQLEKELEEDIHFIK